MTPRVPTGGTYISPTSLVIFSPAVAPSATPAHRPSMRWAVVSLLFAAIAINVIDRQALSLAAPLLRDQLGITNTQYGTMLLFFLAGMFAGQLPSGLLMDRAGPRAGFSIIICLWSAANFSHAFARSVAQFCGLRFVLGAGESGNYSGGVKVIAQWFEPRDRAFAGGVFNSGSLAGSILAPPLIVWLIVRYGWRAAFVVPSAAGLLWLIPWLLVYRDARTSATTAEQRIQRPFSTLLASAPLWGVILMRALAGPVTHFYWYWLPEYLRRERGMPLEMIGIFAWMPFFSGAIGNIGGGWLTRYLIARGTPAPVARKRVFAAAVALCCASLPVPFAPNTVWAMLLICIASMGINAFAASHIGLVAGLFPEPILARTMAFTGMGDNIAGMIAMLATGMIVDRYSYIPVFAAAAALPVLALTAYLILVRDRERHPSAGALW